MLTLSADLFADVEKVSHFSKSWNKTKVLIHTENEETAFETFVWSFKSKLHHGAKNGNGCTINEEWWRKTLIIAKHDNEGLWNINRFIKRLVSWALPPKNGISHPIVRIYYPSLTYPINCYFMLEELHDILKKNLG